MTGEQWAYLILASAVVVACLLAGMVAWDRRLEDRLEADGSRLVAGLDLLRATPEAVDLANPPMPEIARSPLLAGYRRPPVAPLRPRNQPPTRPLFVARVGRHRADNLTTDTMLFDAIAENEGAPVRVHGPAELVRTYRPAGWEPAPRYSLGWVEVQA